jgi:uncharacterized protein YqgV (UPF0045/DUF77 family)
MRITAELSLYPLHDEPVPSILSFIEDLAGDARVELVVNQMSTQLNGELADVVACVHAALSHAFESGEQQVLVAKFLNSDLAIALPPELELDD